MVFVVGLSFVMAMLNSSLVIFAPDAALHGPSPVVSLHSVAWWLSAFEYIFVRYAALECRAP